jgi:hypothetical protein
VIKNSKNVTKIINELKKLNKFRTSYEKKDTFINGKFVRGLITDG